MVTEISKAVQWLKANLPALETLAAESEKVSALKGEALVIRDEIKGLVATRDQIRSDVDVSAKAIDALTAKAKAAREATDKAAQSRLEDLQRQQHAYEDRLAELRTKIEEQGKLHAVREGEHVATLRQIEGQIAAANGQLAQTQQRIRSVHAELAKVGT